MKISEKGLALIKHFEGCLKPVPGLSGHFRAYLCPADKLTIGWGHTNDHGRQFNEGSVWTQAECDAELANDMAKFEAVVERLVKVELKQYQFDALVSFAYNCGAGALGGSTLLRKVNARDFVGAAKEFNRWTHGGGRVLLGLVRRRAAESLLFQGPGDFNGKPDDLIQIADTEPVPQQVDAPPEPKIAPMPAAVGTGTLAAAHEVTKNANETIFEQLSGVLAPLRGISKTVEIALGILSVVGAGLTVWAIIQQNKSARAR